MKHLGTKIKKYLRIYLTYTKINYLEALEYRVSFLSGLLSTTFYTIGYIFFIKTILSRIPTINGWNFNQMLLLYSVSQFAVYLSWAIFRNSLVRLSEAVQTGSFDMDLRFPLSARFLVSFKEQITDLPLPFLVQAYIFAYAANGLHLQILPVILFLFLFICGMIIYYNFLFFIASLSFWVIDGEDLFNFMDDLFSYSRYPMQIFPPPVALIVTFFVPVIFIAYVPTTVLLNILDPKLAIISVFMIFATYFVSEKVWQAGLRRYSSASS